MTEQGVIGLLKKTTLLLQLFNFANVLSRLTRALHDLQGKSLSDAELDSKVKTIFSQCDLNKDGKITEDEFLKAGVGICEMFELENDE